jgi:hypothetical protein
VRAGRRAFTRELQGASGEFVIATPCATHTSLLATAGAVSGLTCGRSQSLMNYQPRGFLKTKNDDIWGKKHGWSAKTDG